MDAPHRALGSILTDLVGDEVERTLYRSDPEAFLAERGYPDFPDRVVGEAVCQVADTLPAPVAEQLAPEVMALSPLTTDDLTRVETNGGHEALGALASVPADVLTDLELDIDGDVGVDAEHFKAPISDGIDDADGADPLDGDESDLDFGTGVAEVANRGPDDPADSLGIDDGDDLVDVAPPGHDVPSGLEEFAPGHDTAHEPVASEVPTEESADAEPEWEHDVE